MQNFFHDSLPYSVQNEPPNPLFFNCFTLNSPNLPQAFIQQSVPKSILKPVSKYTLSAPEPILTCSKICLTTQPAPVPHPLPPEPFVFTSLQSTPSVRSFSFHPKFTTIIG